ncbi:hybrid sensor histidine kinase/response regulator [Herbaspirillum sp. RTI4]|uniref:hybrid sensor histidine kinase/response regulator n=1 Tax=Herbaspirillum sp. RTI4 TaxID=3048640 RepID=UPI002AB3FCA0|nr:hybrid sensor histidine kinase/response regulator [Herbaspirillum sp. RTI4]MDY7579521.1 hybrid sensor histidine kinase/response regulator [Herbaspirillum sp. RTI4]MEA9983149.1 hybrid sensor histidine kinase/response regulator [Herbaspirillum sp. RTI4]
MIEDSELRDLFRIESSEHLQAIESGLLHIEKDPDNVPLLEELFRESHSLKGASRMLELYDIERIFHRFEDILGKARTSGQRLTSAAIDCMCKSLDAIRKLVNEATHGERANVDVGAVLDVLKAADAGDAGGIGAERESATDAVLFADSGSEENVAMSGERRSSDAGSAGQIDEMFNVSKAILGGKAGAEQFVIETIRVETRKLDMLMTHAGELTVAKVRIARRYMDLEELQEKWDQIHLNFKKSTSENSLLSALLEQYASQLENVVGAAYEDSARLDFVTGELEDGIRSVRLLPLSTIFNLFGLMVRKLSRECGKEVELHIEGGDITADKRILEEMKDPLMHIIRNAIDHGLELPQERLAKGKSATGHIRLRAYQSSSNVMIDIEDDGRGLNLQAIRRSALKTNLWREEELAAMDDEKIMSLIFMPGFSTSTFVSDVSGRGVGMDVVHANVKKLKGTVSVSSVPDTSCMIRIQLPLTLATSRVLIVVDNGVKYAVPVEHVQKSYSLPWKDLFTVEGHLATMFEQKAVAVARLGNLLQFKRKDFVRAEKDGAQQKAEERSPCIIMEVNEERFGLIVDELLDEQEIVLKSQSVLLRHINDLSGVTILGTGEVCMVLNPVDFVAELKRQATESASSAHAVVHKKQLILLAEDSLTTRAQMKRILESGGYEVVMAVDGMDAYSKLDTRPFDAIVSDINMPNMDGLELAQKVRSHKKYAKLPLVLVTMLSTDEDKKRGMEAGANAYISKATFEQKLLLDTLKRLV